MQTLNARVLLRMQARQVADSGACLLIARVLQARRSVAIFAIVLILLATLALGRSILVARDFWVTGGDFSGYVRAAQSLARGDDPYDTRLQVHTAFYGATLDREGYPYPPAFAEALVPFVLNNASATRYVWTLLSLGFCAGTAWLLTRGFPPTAPWRWAGLLFGTFLAGATLRADLYHGQVNELLIFLLSLGLYLQFRRRGTLMGVVWGIAIAVKPFLGILVVYLLWRSNWRAAIVGLLTATLIVVASFVPTVSNGAGVVESWLSLSAYYGSAPYAARPDNIAMRGVLLRLFAANPFTVPWTDSATIIWIASACTAAILGLAFVKAVPRGGVAATPATMQLVEFGVVLSLAMSFGPLTEGSHVLFLLPGLAGVLRVVVKRGMSNDSLRANWILAGAAWVAMFVLRVSPVELHPGLPSALDWSAPQGLSVLWTALPTVTLLAAAVLLADVVRREHQRGQVVPTT